MLKHGYVELNGAVEVKQGYYDETLPSEINAGTVNTCRDYYDWKDSISYRYGVSFAKLYTAISGRDVREYQKVSELPGKELFKMNLYPIAFNSTDHSLWHKHGLDSITGFESKSMFNTWCFFNRFAHFAKLRESHRPKLIICTGIDYLRDFLMFFGGNESIEKLNVSHIVPASEANQYDRQYFWLRLSPDTLLVIIPFFSGQYGLNSNHLLQEMGSRIQKLLMSEHDKDA